MASGRCPGCLARGPATIDRARSSARTPALYIRSPLLTFSSGTIGLYGLQTNAALTALTIQKTSQAEEGRETALLESEIAHASSLLDQADVRGGPGDTRLLFNAAESFQRTKDLLSFIELDGEQAAQFHRQLAALQARLLGK
jgi:hypothetical protein